MAKQPIEQAYLEWRAFAIMLAEKVLNDDFEHISQSTTIDLVVPPAIMEALDVEVWHKKKGLSIHHNLKAVEAAIAAVDGQGQPCSIHKLSLHLDKRFGETGLKRYTLMLVEQGRVEQYVCSHFGQIYNCYRPIKQG
jgi:hypothetical protein